MKRKLRLLKNLARTNRGVDMRAAEETINRIRRMRKIGLRRRTSQVVRSFASTRMTATN